MLSRVSSGSRGIDGALAGWPQTPASARARASGFARGAAEGPPLRGYSDEGGPGKQGEMASADLTQTVSESHPPRRHVCFLACYSVQPRPRATILLRGRPNQTCNWQAGVSPTGVEASRCVPTIRGPRACSRPASRLPPSRLRHPRSTTMSECVIAHIYIHIRMKPVPGLYLDLIGLWSLLYGGGDKRTRASGHMEAQTSGQGREGIWRRRQATWAEKGVRA